jgi:hypothetical protein
MSTKGQITAKAASTKAERRQDETTAKLALAEQQKAQLRKTAGTSADLASPAVMQAQDEDDVFSEVPTEANRASPMAGPHSIDTKAGQGLAGAGAYRMLRPAISDRVEIPAPTAPERPANRVIIGIARKS